MHVILTKNEKTFSDHSVHTSGHVSGMFENSIKTSKSVKHFWNQFKQKLVSGYN